MEMDEDGMRGPDIQASDSYLDYRYHIADDTFVKTFAFVSGS